MVLLFRVWNASRCSKIALALRENSENLLQLLLQTSNQKLCIQGSKIVLEQCGTEIDDDETLKCVNQQVLMVLQEGEEWSEISKEAEKTLEQQNVIPEPTPMGNATNRGL